MAERFLLFDAAGEGFALNLRDISEVLESQESFPVPGAPCHFLGLINFHGEFTALVDLGLFLGRSHRQLPENVLVLDARLAQLALSVDGVRAIVTEREILGEAPGEEPLTAALLDTAYGRVRLLRVDTLLFGLEQGLARPTGEG